MIWRAALSVALLLLVPAYLYGVVGLPPSPQRNRVVFPTDVTQLKLQQRYQILIVGTSLTSRGDWPDLLQSQLRECATGQVEVEQLARAGAGSAWGLSALRQHLREQNARVPDIVIIEFSGNDASLVRGLPILLSKRNTQAIIQAARDAGAVVFLATMSPAWRREALERPGQERYHALYRDLAASEGVGLIDTIGDWVSLPSKERMLLVPDGLHPTSEAMNRIVVSAFFSALGPLVCEGGN